LPETQDIFLALVESQSSVTPMPVVIFRSTVPVTVETKGKVISAHSRSKVTGSRARDSSHHESHLNAEVKGNKLSYSYDFLKIQMYSAASKL